MGVVLTNADVAKGEPGTVLPQAEKLIHVVDGGPHCWPVGDLERFSGSFWISKTDRGVRYCADLDCSQLLFGKRTWRAPKLTR